MYRILILIISIFTFTNIYSQVSQDDTYQFFVDLNKVDNDQLTIELVTPTITTDMISYKMPAMVPGTYKVYDFGRYVVDLKAYDAAGGELPVTKSDVNTWDISGATNLYKIVYRVNDTFEDTTGQSVFEPAGTSIEEGKIFVINTHGFFGYLDGHLNKTYNLNFTKPEGFFGSTSLDALQRTATNEILTAPSYQYLVDNPILYNVPDTATVSFDEASILISVYSPQKGITADDMAKENKVLLEAIRKYLGGKLPAEKYTFLYYFSNLKGGSGSFGALEHNNSSLYFMPDVPKEAKTYMIKTLSSTNAHEYYHTVTPLNLHAEQIGNFDFNDPKMSEHLWLYEGVTEYNADYIRLREGLITLEDYAGDMEGKLNTSMRFNDTLPFTVMSKGALDVYEPQYQNVYEKGALIGLCLDILIREESNGSQGLQDVINSLLLKYGKDKSFKDEDLFGEIEALTSPKVRLFLDTYVAGETVIPYEDYFKKIGLEIKRSSHQVIDAGGFTLGFNPDTYRLKVVKLDDPDNKFIKELGIKENDELVAYNGTNINFQNMRSIFGSKKNPAKTGDDFELVVARRDAFGNESKINLDAKISKTKTSYDFTVKVNESMADATVQKAWLGK